MNRRSFLHALPAVLAAPLALWGCGQTMASRPGASTAAADSLQVHGDVPTFEVLDKPHEAWREVVTEDQYYILFEEGTERRFTSDLLDNTARGTYVCAACYLPLFPSTTKYKSGTGWPSFWAPLEGSLGTKEDRSFGMIRTEYHCKRCGGHQGHVFNDGPPPTGLRYCNNGLALRFIPEDEALPALRS
ncbi:MAG: peptide-methionine (R)-S-oxide reductase MsrB [Bacteroidota bacterium]